MNNKVAFNRRRCYDMISLAMGTIILCSSGFCNKFPLLSSDSAAYINSGGARIVSFDRIFGYSLFSGLVSDLGSVWFIILIQGALCSLLVFYCFLYFSNNRDFHFHFITCITFVSVFMTTSVAVSTIQPNVFCALGILGIGLQLVNERLKRRDSVIISMLIVFSAAMDISFLVLFLFLAVGYFFMTLWRVLSKRRFKQSLMNAVYVIFLVGVSCLGTLLVHYKYSGEFKLLRSAQILELPRLKNLNLVQKKLQFEYEHGDFLLGSYNDTLENIVSNQGRFLDVITPDQAKTFELISSSVGFDSLFSRASISKVVLDALQQVVNVKTSEFNISGANVTLHNAIVNWFGAEIREYYLSYQMNSAINFRFLNYCQIVSVGGLIFLSISVSRRQLINKKIFYFLLVGTIANGVITGTIYGCENDMQSHLIWVLAIPYFIYLTRLPVKDFPTATEIAIETTIEQ
ncbi:hypothetical protein ACFFGT_02350 [Mucilaginibacter angelicae]|uniref:Glycosyltransferase RgtA/B/C/D-like domain-containing protein n=1 Tax=Mucilaginibacter angelicae TaxID=869718 RepID=A0ABV6KZW9_9SPHI